MRITITLSTESEAFCELRGPGDGLPGGFAAAMQCVTGAFVEAWLLGFQGSYLNARDELGQVIARVEWEAEGNEC